ncbi:MAG: CRISPR-associated helicase Cas3' [Deltaproteobacteria bacterium]|nr:CRISPR-associated helicase Cas3' [Deltaproteobacteria bacterium]MBW2097315.1 CRISPR-associated helicase Cas3' [Deltaproteobacteria bacterium]
MNEIQEYYSHASESSAGKRVGTKLLRLHLAEVGLSLKNIAAQAPSGDLQNLSSLAYLIGATHDFGKYTTFFQQYLFNGATDGTGRHHHGLLSALFAAYAAEKIGMDSTACSYASLAAYFVVLHHHGDLRALESDTILPSLLRDPDFMSVDAPWRTRLKTLDIQIKDIAQNLPYIEQEYHELMPAIGADAIDISLFLQKWRDVFAGISQSAYRLLNREQDETRQKLFITTLFLYSSLIDSDKKDAAGVVKTKRKSIPADLVDRYREESDKIDIHAKEGMNGLRNEIYLNAVTNISNISLDDHVLTLTAPTGTGKTLTSLSCALKLRQRLQTDSFLPRIIYALPYTSIIDQNYGVIRDILKQLPDFHKDEGVYLVKHHHLSDLQYRMDDEDRPISESLMLVESWESEIVVTTFVQLLHTIIGFKNRFLKKYHNIAGSIIILDEVQNIPIEYWPLVRNMFHLLTRYLGCYIIFSTATKPLIFEEKETTALLEDTPRYFAGLNRVNLIPDLEPVSLDEFFYRFASWYDSSKSYLLVFNTIKTSVEFFGKLKKDKKFNAVIKKKEVIYLSTGIVPAERVERIKTINRLLKEEKRKVIIVSTQLVEAGIDIDVDIVFRDIGPIDSIIQVAGRCNRGMGRDRGQVHVFHLTDGEDGYAKYVYGPTHYATALKLINGNSVEESRFFDLIHCYFDAVRGNINRDISEDIWKAVNHFRFHLRLNLPKSISDFRLIRDKHGYIDVFIEVDGKARKELQDFKRGVIGEKDPLKRQENYLAARNKFKKYVISVPEHLTHGLSHLSERLLYLKNEQIDVYYALDTGFRRIEPGSFIF